MIESCIESTYYACLMSARDLITNMTIVPPIKSQGIKTKLVEWIGESSAGVQHERWVEPFMGTGVVAFNIQPRKALLCDSNPHLIGFYKAIQRGEITPELVRKHLTEEGERLFESGGEHYYIIRERFNEQGNPLDFLFLSRACFNGMMRFNRKGGFNVPFCRKPNRFAQALTTKIVNQISAVSQVIGAGQYEFRHQDFRETLADVGKRDLVYCDPPYIGRHVDYFDSWSEEDERELHGSLTGAGCHFILSTWLRNSYRANDFVRSLWGDCSILTREHFYHVGASEANRNPVVEALLMNFEPEASLPVASLNFDNVAVPPANSGRAKASQLEMAV